MFQSSQLVNQLPSINNSEAYHEAYELHVLQGVELHNDPLSRWGKELDFFSVGKTTKMAFEHGANGKCLYLLHNISVP